MTNNSEREAQDFDKRRAAPHELARCPFCGSSDIANVSAGHAGPSNHWHAGEEIFAVNCRGCGASVPNRYRNSLVVEAWNRRASIPAAGEPVAYLTPGGQVVNANEEEFISSDWTPLYTTPPDAQARIAKLEALLIAVEESRAVYREVAEAGVAALAERDRVVGEAREAVQALAADVSYIEGARKRFASLVERIDALRGNDA